MGSRAIMDITLTDTIIRTGIPTTDHITDAIIGLTMDTAGTGTTATTVIITITNIGTNVISNPQSPEYAGSKAISGQQLLGANVPRRIQKEKMPALLL